MIALVPDGYTGADRYAWWAFSKTESSAQTILIPRGVEFLWLDPATTTPNVVLGVTIGGRRHYMVPGDVLVLPRGTYQVTITNPLRNIIATATQLMVGFLGLKGGTSQELPAVIAARASRAPLPHVGILAAAPLATGAAPTVSLSVPTGPLEGLRITVHPIALADGSPLALPADFACTVDVGVVAATASTTGYDFALASVLPIPNLEDQLSPGLTSWSADMQLVGSAGQNTWDRSVVNGAAAMALGLRSISGTGARNDRAIVIVEGR